MILFFKTIIIIINLFEFKIAQSLCQYDDCFNCTICNFEQICKCKWNPLSKNCINDLTKSAFNFNFDYFFFCYDDDSLTIQKYYCGNYYIKLDEQNTANINLIDVNGKYGAVNLFCEYIYDQISITSDSTDIYINVIMTISPSIMDYIKVKIIITYNNNDIDNKSIDQQKYEDSYKNAKKIKFQIYFKKQLSLNPFSIKITKKELKKNYKIYIALGIVLLACIACGIIIYFISKKASENARRRQQIYLQLARASQRRRMEEEYNRIPPSSSRDPSSSSDSEISSSYEINMKKIEELLKTILSPIKYYKYLGTKDGNPCTVCTICLEDFIIEKSNVSITPCQHIFHFKCLSDWLLKNILNPKCPNCNYNLLLETKNIIVNSNRVSDIPELPCNIKRTNDQRATNIERNERYNEHNNSINILENGMETGETRFIRLNRRDRYDNNCIRSIDSININVHKSQNRLKNDSRIETTGKKDEEIGQVVIESIDNK